MTARVLPPAEAPSPASRPRAAEPAHRRPAVTASRVLTGVAVVLWLVALPSVRHARTSSWGLLFAASPAFAAAALLSVLAFCAAIRRGCVGDGVLAFAAWLAVVRASVSLVAPVPIYAWTYKHIGVADYIRSTGHLAKSADIYMSWPGAFTALAWFSKCSGIGLLAIAQWFALGVHVVIALGVFALIRVSGFGRRVALTGAFVAEVVNWIGQDYLSPQAIAYALALAALVLLVHSRRSPAAGWLSVPLLAAITVTHQLTPYWLTGAAVLLGLLGLVRPRWIGAVYAAIVLGYLGLNRPVATRYGLLSGFDPLSNAQSNVHTAGSAGQQFTAALVKVPSVLLWGGALGIGAWELWRRRRAERLSEPGPAPADGRPGGSARKLRGRATSRRVQVAATLAFTSFTLLAGNNYGGEAIFRVFLYSIPGCALLVAPALTRLLTARTNRPAGARFRPVALAAAGTALTLALAASGLQGYYGGWFTNLVSPRAVAESGRLLAQAEPGALILGMTTGFPDRATARYVPFAERSAHYDSPVDQLPGLDAATASADRVVGVLATVARAADAAVYVVLTRQMRAYSAYYGSYRPGVIGRVERLLRTDGDWLVVTDAGGVTVLRYTGSRG